jgi:hypothetical protein
MKPTTSQRKKLLDRALEKFLRKMQFDQFQSLTDAVIERHLTDMLKTLEAHAVAIWVKTVGPDGDQLTIAYNVGQRGSEIEGKISQPLDEGLVSKAYRENTTICHQGIFRHREQSLSVDLQLGQLTAHQIAAPFMFFDRAIGAITVIQTLDAGLAEHSHWGFDNDKIKLFEGEVAVVQRLFELNFLKSWIG